MALNQAKIIESLEVICSTLDKDEFIFQFLAAYGVAKTTLSRLRDGSRNVGDNGDVGYKKNLYFRSVSSGIDLYQAAERLKAESVIASNDIRFVMVTDFMSLIAFDLKAGETLDTDIRLLDKQYAFFLPLIAGYEKAVMYSEHPADIKASEKMGQLYDLIRERNDLSKSEDIHALNVFLTRLLFCFFAEDTGIFEQDQMTRAIESTTPVNGADLDQFFLDLFAALNLPEGSPEKSKLADHLQNFPYVNGGLFKTDEPIPEFSTKARRILLECGSLSWAEINPDIFGSMFQAVIDQEQRGNLGQHYTSVSNIMKVIKPLFLDKLSDALDQARGKEKKLKELLVRLQNIQVFDPACGSGNFLIIAYKELRKIEMAVINALNETGAQPEMYYSGISLSQFYGIEIDDFAHEVAILSLWLAEHQMNLEFKDKFGYSDATLPLKASGNILAGNALRLDWKMVCPLVDDQGNKREIYICGNPPFVAYSDRDNGQKEDMSVVFEGHGKVKRLDYVSCWLTKAAEFIHICNETKSAFVVTNSIFQGEQVPLLWPIIFNTGCEIFFAYDSFKWTNSAQGTASVTCAVVGIHFKDISSKYFYQKNQRLTVNSISSYLTPGTSFIVQPSSFPIANLPAIQLGSSPIDGGFLVLNEEEANSFLKRHPDAQHFIKRFSGGRDLLDGTVRYCLWIDDDEIADAMSFDLIRSRVIACKDWRLRGGRDAKKAADTPHKFYYRKFKPGKPSISFPMTSSENRRYFPVEYCSPDVVLSHGVLVVYTDELSVFAMLSSQMHHAWIRAVAGRLKSDYRYSATLVYNTFPWPEVSEKQRTEIEALAEEILLIREDHPDKTLADLYDPDKMPAPLLEAHQNLDHAVEKLYRAKPFADASERLEHLFGLYERLIAKEKKGA